MDLSTLVALIAVLSATPAESSRFTHPSPDQADARAPATLAVSPNGRYLETSDGEPFFWLGDTAWELFHRLDREEADHYLAVRAAQGFTVVQAVVLAEQDGLGTPNAYGHLPLIDGDPLRPNEAYFEHVDAIVENANARGIVVGMLPTWGDKFNRKWGVGPEIFTPENAEAFGRYIGRRYADASVVWILGGDRLPEEEADFAVIEAMARGLKAGDDGRHLVTYHPWGGASSAGAFHEADWLDFNMHQSGHGEPDCASFQATFRDYRRSPVKPVLDGEPCYEDIPIGFDPENGWFSAVETRRAGYASLLAGALGHTYGHNAVWQMWEPGRPPVIHVRTPWPEALHYPGAYQAGYMRAGFEALDWWTLEPAQALLADGPREAPRAVRVAASPDRRLVVAYAPMGTTFSLRVDGGPGRAVWFNPRDGTRIPLTPREPTGGTVVFDPPADESRGNDWLLVLEAAGP
jgi:hypothetical protein